MKVTIYSLSGGATPLSWKLPTRHTHRKPLLQYDEEKDESRALRYASNQRSFYEDEQKGEVILKHIFFDDGELKIPQNNPTLRKFMEIHPDNEANGGNKFFKVDPQAIAKANAELLDNRFEAMKLVRELSFDEQKSVMRTVIGDRVDHMESSALVNDIKLLAQNEPDHFLSLVDDPEVETNNDIARIVESKMIQIRKTGVFWSTDEKKTRMLEIPYGEDPMVVLENFFMYDKEGLKIYKELLDKLDSE